MRNVNKVTLIGNATNDPECKKTPSGISVCTFGLATNRYWKDKSGEKQSSVEFHNLACFGKFAEFCGEAIQKGKPIYVEGHLKTHSWENPEKVTLRRTEVIVDNIVLLAPKKAGVEAEETEEETAEAEVAMAA